MNSIDRRRIALASALTVAVIPALLILDAQSSKAPATVSADSERLGVEGDDTAPGTSVYEPETPMFVGGGDEPTPPGVIDVAVPPAPGANEELVKASYSRYDGAASPVCTATFAPDGATLTVVNIDNGQSTRCINTYGKMPPSGADMVLDTNVFTEIGDLTDAPIPVRVSLVTVHNPNDINALLARGGIAPRRDLGQNFVADANTVRRIARLADVGPRSRVVEIGAGLGSLTLALAETGADVTAVEVDRGVVPLLRELTEPLSNITVVEADAMTLDWPTLLGDHDDWVLVANLPYNVATPLVCDLLDGVPQVQRMLVMVQREVAERFCATPRTSVYGAVSVKLAYWATARIAGVVPASVFVPRPNVESALADIRRRPAPAVDVAPEPLFRLVRTAFGQRRKMLRRSLAGVVTPDVFDAAGIDAQRRPEELDVHEWGALTASWLAAEA